jgi:hypothetical protein
MHLAGNGCTPTLSAVLKIDDDVGRSWWADGSHYHLYQHFSETVSLNFIDLTIPEKECVRALTRCEPGYHYLQFQRTWNQTGDLLVTGWCKANN